MNTREGKSSSGHDASADNSITEAQLAQIDETLSDIERRIAILEATLHIDQAENQQHEEQPVHVQALSIAEEHHEPAMEPVIVPAPAPVQLDSAADHNERDGVENQEPIVPVAVSRLLSDDPRETLLSIDALRQPEARVDRIIINVVDDDLSPVPLAHDHAHDDEEQVDSACCMRAKAFRPLLYIGPVSVALTEAADVGRSLYKSGNTSLAITITAGSAAFLSSIGLTGETTKKNFDVSCDIIKKRKLPADWPKLSRGKEALAIAIVVVPAVWGPIAKSMQAYYFMDALPAEYNFENKISILGWAVGSSLVAFGAGATDILTNDAEMYKVVREKLAGHSNPYSNKFSKIVSPWLGGTLGLMNAAQDSIQSYIAIKTIFNVTSVQGRIIIGVPSALNMIPTFSFDGMFSINAMDELFGYLQKRKFEPTKILAFSMSVTLAVYLAFLKRGLNISFYGDVTKDFGLDPANLPAEIFETLSWAMFVQDSVQGTATLYEPMHGLVTRIGNKVASAGRCMFGLFCSSHDSDPEDRPAHPSARDVEQGTQEENRPLLSASSSAASPRMFRDTSNDDDNDSPRPRRRRSEEERGWCGIM
jgi:hypothetical protein